MKRNRKQDARPADRKARSNASHEDILDLIGRLTAAPGPSGYEGRAAEAVKRELSPLSDEVRVDAMGSVVALKRAHPASRRQGPKEPIKVLLAAHLDEIGLLVTAIEPGGFLRFTKVGGCDPRILLGQEMVVHPFTKSGPAAKREIPGIIGAKPPHFQTPEEAEAVLRLPDLYIDTGLTEAEVRHAISVGDVASFKPVLVRQKNDRAASKAMDDRVCLAIMVRALAQLWGTHHDADIYAVATVQEEVGLGCLGALSATFRVNPDLALALDVTHGDMPHAPESETYPLGKGPAIAVGANIHPAIADRLRSIAKRLEIPYQIEPCPGVTGTDAMDIQVSTQGVPTGLLGVPVRYMHTPVETVAVADVERAARLLAQFLSEAHEVKLEWNDEE